MGVAVGWPWVPLWRGRGSVCAAAGRALPLSLHCSLLQGKEACEETALRVVKETKSEGEEGPSRGEATEQVSISTSPLPPFPPGNGAVPARLQPRHPGVGMGLVGLQHLQRGWACSSPPPELKGLEELLGVTRMAFCGGFCLVGPFLSAFWGSWDTGEL